MRKLCLCLGGLLFSAIGLAQPAIEKECHLLRAQDYLYKQQVGYVSPQPAGENLVWNFSNLKVIDEEYRISHMEYSDSLLVTRELKTLYKQALKGDTLVSTGIESSTLVIEYENPQLQLIYPVNYNDKEENYYYGTGDYCKQINLVLCGKTSYHADAYGTLILPEGDTLQVIRIKHTCLQIEDQFPYADFSPFPAKLSTDSIAWRISNDSLITRTDTYRWYAEGYRYPVFESIEYYIHRDGKCTLQASASFYFPPNEQYYGLDNDSENQEKRELMAMERENKMIKGKNQRNGDYSESSLLAGEKSRFDYTLHQERQEGILTVDYEIYDPMEVALILLDTQGKVLAQTSKEWKIKGVYQENFSLKDYLQGEYLLQIISGEDIHTEKIMK